jgi:hypothetical protein
VLELKEELRQPDARHERLRRRHEPHGELRDRSPQRVELRFKRRAKLVVPGNQQKQAQTPEDSLSRFFARDAVDFGDCLLLLRNLVLEARVPTQ